MGQTFGYNKFGLYENGDARLGSNENFTWATYNAETLTFNRDVRKAGRGSFRITGGSGGSAFSSLYVPVDTSETYQCVMYAKTRVRGSSGNLAGGHIGFACYDKNKSFIDLRNCGGVGNTTLSRAASPGDSIIYLTSNSGWYTGSDVTNNRAYFRILQFYPASHPDYSTAHEYTRLNNRAYYRLELTDQGDYACYVDGNTGSQTNYGSGAASTLPDYGYSLPAGTPISRGVAGGTYNYAMGNPNYPEGVWTRYATAPFTGESRNSGTPFRYGTKFIRFMILRNYNRRTETQDHQWAIANMFFAKCLPGQDFRDYFPTTG